MSKNRIFLLIQAAVCIALTVLLSVAAVAILREGLARRAVDPTESVYTPEIISEKLAPITPLMIAGAGLLIAGLALGIKDEDAERPVQDAEIRRDLVVARVPQLTDAMRRQRAVQKRLRAVGFIAFAVCMVPTAIFLVNPNHFPQGDPEGMFIGLLRVLLPWTAAGLFALAAASLLRERSLLRETDAARTLLKSERMEGIAPGPKANDPQKKQSLLQAAIVIAAVILIIAGIFNGGARDVLYKAITICTECIGLG